jgi:hypothetical protein
MIAGMPTAVLEGRAAQLNATLGRQATSAEIDSVIDHVREQMDRSGKMLAEQGQDSGSETDMKEVEQYARYLGMDIEEDADLLFVAKFAMEADVPAGWTACIDESGEEFFCNLETGAVQREHPMDDKYKTMYRDFKAKKHATGAE